MKLLHRALMLLAVSAFVASVSVFGASSCSSGQRLSCARGMILINDNEFAGCSQCASDCSIRHGQQAVRDIVDVPKTAGKVTIVCGQSELAVAQTVKQAFRVRTQLNPSADAESVQTSLECL